MAPYVSVGGASPLWKWLSTVDPVAKRLAWCHTTDAFRLRKIIAEGAFSPSHCDVFDEDLLYFFYGRPAFRRGNQSKFDSELVNLSLARPPERASGASAISQGARGFLHHL